MPIISALSDSLPFALLAALVGTGVLTLALARLAPALGLIDHPDLTRKNHSGTPAVVGGIAIFLALAMTCVHLRYDVMSANLSFFAAGLLLVVVGAIDDRFDLRAPAKLAAQLAAAAIIIWMGKAALLSLGHILPGGAPLSLGKLSIPLTMLAIVVLLNAWNMIDGLDGLATGITLTCLFWMCLVIFLAQVPATALALPMLAGAALIGFLPFNAPRDGRRLPVFLGDAGSLFLGLLMAWLPLKLTQDTEFKVSPVTMAWILALPVFDMTWVALQRLSKGRNPMSGDATHLHHLLCARGYAPARTVQLMVGLSLVYGGIGALGWMWHVPQYALLALWVATLTLHGAMRKSLAAGARK